MTDTNKPMPEWLALGADAAIIQLSKPVELNGVRTDRISLRSPTIGDMRAANKLNKDDDEAKEIQLFATLAECGVADIERLTLRDYGRLQEGYFRLVSDNVDA